MENLPLIYTDSAIIMYIANLEGGFPVKWISHGFVDKLAGGFPLKARDNAEGGNTPLK
jgi:hypothetical protein